MDLTKFEPLRTELNTIGEKCKNIIINDEGTLSYGKELAKEAKSVSDKIETIRTELVKPLNEEVKSINNYAKELTLPLTNGIALIRNRILSYENEKEKIRIAEEQRIRTEKLIAEMKRKEEEDKLKQENSEIKIPVIATTEERELHQELKEVEKSKSKDIRKVWTYRVVNLNLVPREYLMLNESAVKEAIKNGNYHISGLEIFQETKLNLR